MADPLSLAELRELATWLATHSPGPDPSEPWEPTWDARWDDFYDTVTPTWLLDRLDELEALRKVREAAVEHLGRLHDMVLVLSSLLRWMDTEAQGGGYWSGTHAELAAALRGTDGDRGQIVRLMVAQEVGPAAPDLLAQVFEGGPDIRPIRQFVVDNAVALDACPTKEASKDG